jgi:hypothetical protein
MQKETTFYYKDGRRYKKISHWDYMGLPTNGILRKFPSGFSCVLMKKEFNENIDIEKLCYLSTKEDEFLKQLRVQKLSVYNISQCEFFRDIIKQLSIKQQ